MHIYRLKVVTMALNLSVSDEIIKRARAAGLTRSLTKICERAIQDETEFQEKRNAERKKKV